MVAVPKKDMKLRVCMDYMDLNKAYSKGSFPLSYIDQIVDATADHKMLSYLDAFSGYHQIPIFSPDEENMTFLLD